MKRVAVSKLTTVLFGLLNMCLFGCDDPEPVDVVVKDQGMMNDAAVSSQDQGGDAATSLDALVGVASRGQPLYDEFCGFCHAPDGTGYLADNANALSNRTS